MWMFGCCMLHGCCTIKENDSGVKIICVPMHVILWILYTWTWFDGCTGSINMKSLACILDIPGSFLAEGCGYSDQGSFYCFLYSFIVILGKYIKYVGCTFLVSRHWSWILITSTVCVLRPRFENQPTYHPYWHVLLHPLLLRSSCCYHTLTLPHAIYFHLTATPTNPYEK